MDDLRGHEVLSEAVMKMKLAATVSLLLLSGAGWAQQCPEGIPSAGNPQCLPPQDERSPYHQGSGYGNDVGLAAPKPVWASRWGAIASDGNGTYGIVTDITSKRKAEKAAIQECKNRGGRACSLEFSYHNQCAAVGASTDNSFSSGAPTIEEATDRALQRCESKTGEKCRVYYSGCSDAVRVQ